jgi:hypothetical protein
MLLIRQKEKAAKEDILNNPVKMAKIYYDLQKKLDPSSNLQDKPRSQSDRHETKEERRVRKEAKRERKRQKHEQEARKNDQHENRENSDSDNNDNKRKHGHDKDKQSDERRKTDGTRHYNDNRKDKERQSYRIDDEKKYEDRRNYDDASRADYKRSYNHERDHSEERRGDDGYNRSRRNGDWREDHKNDVHSAESTVKSSFSNGSSHSHRKGTESSLSQPRYGLLKESKHASNTNSTLGPSPMLLAQKSEKDRLEKEAKQSKLKENVKVLDPMEKERRLREMEMNAESYDRSRSHRTTNHTQTSVDIKTESGGDATFLRNMRSEVYTSSSTSMEDRLHQQRFYTQSTNDMETKGFLKRQS